MNNLKWFWRVNYVLTIYFLLGILFIFINPTSSSSWFGKFVQIITLNSEAAFYGFYIEWLQFPIGLLIIISMKNQRTFLHIAYLVLLIFLAIAKFIFMYLGAGFVGGT